MSWLLPSALVIAGVAAIAAIALHFIARSRPLAEPLPTARFIPPRPIRARTRSTALSDLLLLLLRIAALLVLGAAAAGPVIARHRGGVARVVVVDRSRAVASARELADSARAAARSGDIILLFDSAAHVANARALDSLRVSSATGSLSAALAAAIAVGSRVTAADSVEITLVSPFAQEEVDAATRAIRSAWPGRVGVMRVAAVPPDMARPLVDAGNDSDDPVVAALGLLHMIVPSATVRLQRGRVSASDSVWAAGAGHVLVHWPRSDSAAIWPKRARIDAIGAATSPGGTVVGRFPRLWLLRGTAVARWADGEPAATEHAVGAGCIRDVGVLLDPASDLTLRAPFREFIMPLFAACGGGAATASLGAGALAALAGRGPLATTAALHAGIDQSSASTPWLLALGALLLIAELAARRTKAVA